MFLRTVINLTTCIYILSCNCQNSNYHDPSRIIKDRVDSMERLLGILNPSSSLNEHEIIAKKRILNRFRADLKEKYHAEHEFKKTYLNHDVMVDEMKTHRKMLHLLGFITRLETKADDLYPVRRPFKVGVVEAYKKILTSKDTTFENHLSIIIFRKRLDKYNLSIPDFIEAIAFIKQSIVGKINYSILELEIDSFPKYNDVEDIKEMFQSWGITPDDAIVKVTQIVLEPIRKYSSTASTP